MPRPPKLLMCPPTHFAIVDIKNPFMQAHVGNTDIATAQSQWKTLRATFAQAGVEVLDVPATQQCEDMVFCANPIFPGLNAHDERVCMLSNMRHESRRREVAAYRELLEQHDYAFREIPSDIRFEGGGDAVWHPGRRLIWGGVGPRSAASAYEHVADAFGAPVLRLQLATDDFYHLDTCLCAVDERTALLYDSALAPDSTDLIRAVFKDVIDVPRNEAINGMACNASAVGEKQVVIQRGNPVTTAALHDRGFTVHEVATDEFMKSGGSVYCMKCYLW